MVMQGLCADGTVMSSYRTRNVLMISGGVGIHRVESFTVRNNVRGYWVYREPSFVRGNIFPCRRLESQSAGDAAESKSGRLEGVA